MAPLFLMYSKQQHTSLVVATCEATCVSGVCVLIAFMADFIGPHGTAEPVSHAVTRGSNS